MLPEVWGDGVFGLEGKGEMVWALGQYILDGGSDSLRRSLHLPRCFMKEALSPMADPEGLREALIEVVVQLRGEARRGSRSGGQRSGSHARSRSAIGQAGGSGPRIFRDNKRSCRQQGTSPEKARGLA